MIKIYNQIMDLNHQTMAVWTNININSQSISLISKLIPHTITIIIFDPKS